MYRLQKEIVEIVEEEASEESGGGTLPTAQRCLDFYINACLANGANFFDLLRHMCSKVKVAVVDAGRRKAADDCGKHVTS